MGERGGGNNSGFTWEQVQFSGFSLFTLGYSIYIVYRNIEIKGEKKEVNGFGRSVWWSEELSFRANYRHMEILIIVCAWCLGNYGGSHGTM